MGGVPGAHAVDVPRRVTVGLIAVPNWKRRWLDFSHAEDICYAIYLIIKKEVEIENLILSSNKLTSVNSLITYLFKKYKKKIKLDKQLKNKKINLIGNNRLAKKVLNWKIKKNSYHAINDIYQN